MDLRVQFLRNVLLCVLGVVLWFVLPTLEASVVLIGAGIGFMPGCGCHCGATCSFCLSPAPSQFQIIVADLGDDPTYGENCVAEYNGTFVLDYVSQPSSILCLWKYDLPGPYCTGETGTAYNTYWLRLVDIGPSVASTAIVSMCNAARTVCDNNNWSTSDAASINYDCEDIDDPASLHSFGIASYCCVPGGGGPGVHRKCERG